MATLEARCTPKGSAASQDSDDWSASRYCFGRCRLKAATYHHPNETAQSLAHLHVRSNIDARKLQMTLIQLRNLQLFRGAIGLTSDPRQIGPMAVFLFGLRGLGLLCFARGLVEVLGLAQAEVPDLGLVLARISCLFDSSTAGNTETRISPETAPQSLSSLSRGRVRWLRPAAGQNVPQNVEVLW